MAHAARGPSIGRQRRICRDVLFWTELVDDHHKAWQSVLAEMNDVGEPAAA